MTTRPHDSSPAFHPLKHLLALGLLAALGMGTVWITGGRIGTEKLATRLVMPCSLVWLCLTAVCYFALMTRQRLVFLMTFLAWSVFTLASNPIVASWLTRSLEREYFSVRPLQGEGYDIVVVLGGGSMIGANQEVQLAHAGDRIAMAARLYHAGKTKTIVCTGSKIEGLQDRQQLSPAEQYRTLLRSLGVPDQALDTIQGRNTSEEIDQLARLMAERPGRRVGLLTSAWHLPRAMRLARAAELQVYPIPADFRSRRAPLTVLRFVPSGLALYDTRLMIHEYLGMLVAACS